MENSTIAQLKRIRFSREIQSCGLSGQNRCRPHGGLKETPLRCGDYADNAGEYSRTARRARKEKPRRSPAGVSEEKREKRLVFFLAFQSRAQNIAERGAGIGRTVLLHRFLFLPDFPRLDR